MQVGAVMLRSCIDDDQIQQLVENGVEQFPRMDSFRYLFAQFARQIKGTDDGYVAGRPSGFIFSHAWHLGEVQDRPIVRVWLQRDKAEFSLSRASTPQVSPGYGMSPQEVIDESFAAPATVRPEPGDALVFVDRGAPEFTGTSTFHRVDTAGRLMPIFKLMIPSKNS